MSEDEKLDMGFIEPELEPEVNAVTTQEIRDGLERIRNLPCIESAELHRCIYTVNASDRSLEVVEVDKIVGAPFLSNWADIDKAPEYMARMATAMRNGKLDLRHELVYLEKVGGVYLVSIDGRTRTAVAKIEGLDKIPAIVDELKFDSISVFDQEDYEILLARREAGLWQGALNEQEVKDDDWWRFYATGEITNYEGYGSFAEIWKV